MTGTLYGFSETALDTAERLAWATVEASNLERTEACILETINTETIAYKRGLEDQVEKIKTVLRNYTSRGRTNIGVVLGLLWKAFGLFMASLVYSRKLDKGYANAARLEFQEMNQAMESMAQAIEEEHLALEQETSVSAIEGSPYNMNQLGSPVALEPELDQRGGVPTPEYQEARRRANAIKHAQMMLQQQVQPAIERGQRLTQNNERTRRNNLRKALHEAFHPKHLNLKSYKPNSKSMTHKVKSRRSNFKLV